MTHVMSFDSFLNESLQPTTASQLIKKIKQENPFQAILDGADTLVRDDVWGGLLAAGEPQRIELDPEKYSENTHNTKKGELFSSAKGYTPEEKKLYNEIESKFILWWNNEIVPAYEALSDSEKSRLDAEDLLSAIID